MDPGIFTLKRFDDLLAKLARDYKLLCTTPTDADVCFNFFVTAEHLPEWYFRGDSKAAAELRKQHPLLRVCSHLANGAKHFEVDRHDAIASTATETVVRFVPDGPTTPRHCTRRPTEHFFISLSVPEAQHLGTSIAVTELARLILEFWGDYTDHRRGGSGSAR